MFINYYWQITQTLNYHNKNVMVLFIYILSQGQYSENISFTKRIDIENVIPNTLYGG